jgi:hypothetical protein
MKEPHMTDHPEFDIEKKAANDGSFAIAYAVLQLAEAQRRVANELSLLGHADNYGSRKGALELVADSITKFSEVMRDRE